MIGVRLNNFMKECGDVPFSTKWYMVANTMHITYVFGLGNTDYFMSYYCFFIASPLFRYILITKP